MKNQKWINKKPFLIAGPCSAESQEQVLHIANSIKGVADVFRAGIWKPRTSPNSFEGIGEKGLVWLEKVKQETSMLVATEVATPKHVELCLKKNIDILWIGARTTVNPFYVQEIANSLKGVNIPVLVKNPIHPDLGLWIGAIERLNKVGISKIAAIHRGFYSYDKLTFRNDPKWEVPIRLREISKNIPIICDPSHITGKRALIPTVSQTAMDLNFDGLMIETHNNPNNALSDPDQQVKPKKLSQIVNKLIIRNASLRNKELKLQLLELRNKIDVFDEEIIELLSKRKCVVEKIGKFKIENELTIFQLERWFEILRSRKQIASAMELDEEMISEFFALVHKYSIIIQTKVMQKK